MCIDPTTLVISETYAICYLSKDGTYSERLVTVEDVVRRNGHWLVIGKCHARGQRRSFLLSGIKDVRSTALAPARTFAEIAAGQRWLPILSDPATVYATA